MGRDFSDDDEAEYADYGEDCYGDDGEMVSCTNCGKMGGDSYMGEDAFGNQFCSVECQRQYYKRQNDE